MSLATDLKHVSITCFDILQSLGPFQCVISLIDRAVHKMGNDQSTLPNCFPICLTFYSMTVYYNCFACAVRLFHFKALWRFLHEIKTWDCATHKQQWSILMVISWSLWVKYKCICFCGKTFKKCSIIGWAHPLIYYPVLSFHSLIKRPAEFIVHLQWTISSLFLPESNIFNMFLSRVYRFSKWLWWLAHVLIWNIFEAYISSVGRE